MANQEHLQIIQQGVAVWNRWRDENPSVVPNLSGANLRPLDLSGANLSRAILNGANFGGAKFTMGEYLSGANLKGANLSDSDIIGGNFVAAWLEDANLSGAVLAYSNFSGAILNGADLSGANLHYATLVETYIAGASLSNTFVYGTSIWSLQGVPARQDGIIITREDEPVITVDDLEVAQFIYLLLNHQKLRHVINSVTERGVLLLGRFGGGGLSVLQSLAAKLKDLNYLPIIFDFERPRDRNYTEVVKTLAGISRFVIVDLSGPSVPQELYATVPHFKIPFVPIVEQGRAAYAMIKDILEYDWVLRPPVEYGSIDQLIEQTIPRIITPAEQRLEKRQRLLAELFNG